MNQIDMFCFHQMLLMFSQDETGTYHLLTIFSVIAEKKHAKEPGIIYSCVYVYIYLEPPGHA